MHALTCGNSTTLHNALNATFRKLSASGSESDSTLVFVARSVARIECRGGHTVQLSSAKRCIVCCALRFVGDTVTCDQKLLFWRESRIRAERKVPDSRVAI